MISTFNIVINYPLFDDETNIVKNNTSDLYVVLNKIIITLTSLVLLYSCADYKTQQIREGDEKIYYFSKHE